MNVLSKESYGLPILLAIGLHMMIFVTAFIAVDFSDNNRLEPKRPPIVNATVIDISQTIIGQREEQKKKNIQQQAIIEKKKKDKEAQQKAAQLERRKALETQKKELARAKAAKEKAVRQAAAVKKAESDKKKSAEAAKKKEQQALIAKAEADKKKRLEQEEATEAKRKKLAAELERQAAERERQKTAAREAEKERLAKEATEAAAKKKAEEAKRASEEAQMVQSIGGLINDRIAAAWNRPPSARNGMKTELAISFLPAGDVLAVNVIKGSGDALFDQRAANAARSIRVEELSKVDPYVFDRNFRKVVIIFNPQDLRN